MAHNIEIRNGVASFAENGKKERAWHKLGQVFDGAMTVKEAITACHADYKVEKFPLAVMTPDISDHLSWDDYYTPLLREEVENMVLKDKMATVRTDTNEVLGVVSKGYGIVQNEDAFRFIDKICTGCDGSPVIESAGVLGHGERVFVTARFPDHIRLDNKGDDLVDMNVVFTTSHDGSGAVNCMVTPVRVVCNNTLNLALDKNYGMISLRHTLKVKDRLNLDESENVEFAYRTLNLYSVYKKSLEGTFDALRKVKVTDKDIDSVIANAFFTEKNKDVFNETRDINHNDISSIAKNLVASVKESLFSGIGQDLCERGTGLWLINGLTTFFQNDCKFRSDERKFESLMYGQAYRRINRAYKLLAV